MSFYFLPLNRDKSFVVISKPVSSEVARVFLSHGEDIWFKPDHMGQSSLGHLLVDFFTEF